MFVTPQDFIDLPYNLPKMTETATITAMNKFITRNEKSELRLVLGTTFYNALVAGVNNLPAVYAAQSYMTGATVLYGSDIYISLVDNNNVVPGTDVLKWQPQPSNRWAKLLVGEDYEDINSAEENWCGMKELVKPLIYGLWLRDSIDTSVQGSGVIQQTSENATNVTSAIRFSDALQVYSDKVGKIENCEEDTLYNYLYTKSTDFDDIVQNISLVNGSFKSYLNYYFQNPGFVNDFDI